MKLTNTFYLILPFLMVGVDAIQNLQTHACKCNDATKTYGCCDKATPQGGRYDGWCITSTDNNKVFGGKNPTCCSGTCQVITIQG
ncbi:hypothetical protein Moror_878 [Moniliophthora roreri MCA 2997]|uniref:Uncharacterized protein n=1 Tax=Moniliophthora roreri (strain MCA 2997) TaxID=1381753 RepID=V2XBG1_MONRO|nr:hypothetical protein Moror_878 [Moniliophthora roreri MCA 2997]KAI3606326.1 hypothetical protein WG66_009522 [Moniliophthora roreri]